MSAARRRSAPARLAAAGLAALLLLAGCSSGGRAAERAPTPAGSVPGPGAPSLIPPAGRDAAPDVSGTLLDGAPFHLSSLRGDVVVLNFWGSWCAPCRAEAPELMAVYTATKGDGVRFVGINVKDQRQLAQAFDRSKGVTYPSVFDPEGRIALQFRDYPPNTIPSTIVLDRRRRVAAVFLHALQRADLLPLVRQLAQEQP